MQNLIIDFIIFASLPGTLQSEGEGAAPIPHILFLTVTKLESYDILVTPLPIFTYVCDTHGKELKSQDRALHPLYTHTFEKQQCMSNYYILRCQTFILIVWSIIAHFITQFFFIYTVYEMHLTISQIKMHNYPLLFLWILNSVFVAYYIIWM